MESLIRCPSCGAQTRGAGPRGLCPACLLGLAVEAGADPDPGDGSFFPAPVYRVLTVLSSDADRTTYLAEQGDTRRLVALDVVRMPSSATGDSLEECRAKLRALMRWSHRGAPRVIDGRPGPSGDFYVVSEYVKGQRLDRFSDAQKLLPAERARLFSEVCDTIADAHRHGVRHGRLRPDMAVASGPSDEVRPVVLGFSVTPGWSPTIADDVAGLRSIARAMRWRDAGETCTASIDAIRDAAHDAGNWEPADRRTAPGG